VEIAPNARIRIDILNDFMFISAGEFALNQVGANGKDIFANEAKILT
jgi:hypothetical protein